MPRAVVTGAAGFLGSHLCEALLARGYEVVGYDNFLTGHRDTLADLAASHGFSFVEQDVCRPLAVAGPVDAVLHMASPASPPEYLKLPLETLMVGSEGTHRALELAGERGARFLLASTSEVYGDPLVHPQPESYWGNVNPAGLRSVYDEAKRFAEALSMAFHRERGVDVKIVRIFNSILADEQVLYDDGVELRREPIGALAARVGCSADLRGYAVPAFDQAGAMSARRATALVGHPPTGPCFEVRTRYGRSIRVTGDHSLFVEGPGGVPEPRPVSQLRVGDRVAIAGRIVVPERDRREVRAPEVWDRAGLDPWRLMVRGGGLGAIAWEHRHEALGIMTGERRSTARSSREVLRTAIRRFRDRDQMPLALLRRMGVAIPPEARVLMRTAGATAVLPETIRLSDELLWLFGVYVAEGCWHRSPDDAFISVSCDDETLDRAQKVIERDLGVHVVRAPGSPGRGPALFTHSRLLLLVLEHLGLLTPEKRIPGWILGLPLARLGWFLEGYLEGDGVHSGAKFDAAVRHEFSTTSEALKDDLVVALGRFGIVPSIGRHATHIRKKTGDREYPFWRVAVPNVAPWDILEWHRGVVQQLGSRRTGDLVWAKVRAIHEVEPTQLVYDFCVPGAENFLAGTGILAHNTYGPRLAPGDGRVVSNFLAQALAGAPLTVYGDGNQTRSFCYVDDEVRGLIALLESDWVGPMNIGNPDELTVLQLAKEVIAVTGSRSPLVYEALPVDDPKVRRPDITLAREVLGWEPETGLREGLTRTAEWYGGRRG